MKKYCIIILGLTLMFTACKPKAADKQKAIADMEETSYQVYDTAQLHQLLDAYAEYVKLFPQDSLTPEYLLRAGSINIKMGNGGAALQNFDRIINYYPHFSKLPEVYYYKAYTYEAVIFDLEMAKAGYMEFINRFPDHSMVTDAQLSIKYLGMTPDEIVASFDMNDEEDITNNTTEE